MTVKCNMAQGILKSKSDPACVHENLTCVNKDPACVKGSMHGASHGAWHGAWHGAGRRCADALVRRWPVRRYASTPVRLCAGAPVRRCAGAPVRRCAGDGGGKRLQTARLSTILQCTEHARSIARSIVRSIARNIARSIPCPCADALVRRWPVRRYAGTPVRLCAGAPVRRCAGAPATEVEKGSKPLYCRRFQCAIPRSCAHKWRLKKAPNCYTVDDFTMRFPVTVAEI